MTGGRLARTRVAPGARRSAEARHPAARASVLRHPAARTTRPARPAPPGARSRRAPGSGAVIDGRGMVSRALARVGLGPTAGLRDPRLSPAPDAGLLPRRERGRGSAVLSFRPGGFVLLLALIAVLVVIGLVMVLSASSVEALRQYGSSWYFFKRQLMWVTLGSTAMAVTMRMDYRWWRRMAGPLLCTCCFMLLVVLVPGIGVRVGGSSRWLGFGAWRVQPSELAKLAMALYCADLLARRRDRMRDLRVTLRPILVVLFVVAMLVMRQPDMGTTLVLASIVVSILFVAGTPLPALVGTLALGAAGAFALGMTASYRRARLLSFLHPWSDRSNTGYQLVQSIVGLASGGVAGVGLGASRAKWGFLPNAHTDFIFAIVGEELGLLGSLLVVALFAALAVLGVRAAARAPDRFGVLLGTGITAWLVGQAVINIGTVVGILPVTGVPLPFVSFGGSSLVIAMGAVGILLNIARNERRPSSSAL